ncbi:CTP synthase [Bifidobacterium cebidarum]|uniref:CTP synthase n=1 Tax=Bifidobacterium cebidarum TaxID=2650773 RepID=A0A6I1G844_9BIFI|nr:CTP synthase [Bifidobacterium cebidarum]KAB7787554.1 CTP synthase [Bifidobacterium cebidarum]
MRTHTELEHLCNEAERNLRCFYPATNAIRRATHVRLQNGYIVRPFRNVYARTAYWSTLNPAEQMRHITRTLSQQFPNRIFAGISAASMLHLDYSWSLHADGCVFIASKTGNSKQAYRKLKRIIMPHPPISTLVFHQNNNGIGMTLVEGATTSNIVNNTSYGTDIVQITSPARTLVDCGLKYPFAQSLPLFDSAMRQELTTAEQIIDICDDMQIDCGPIFRLMHYMNPLSENGGESLCRAVIIEAGFVVPKLQRVFIDPDAPRKQYRVDFCWHTFDGRLIVLEYDGAQKYVNPEMTNRRSIQDVIHKEKEREDVLRKAGVTAIIRTTFDEVLVQTPLIQKLAKAGVPTAGSVPTFVIPSNTQRAVTACSLS